MPIINKELKKLRYQKWFDEKQIMGNSDDECPRRLNKLNARLLLIWKSKLQRMLTTGSSYEHAKHTQVTEREGFWKMKNIFLNLFPKSFLSENILRTISN